MPVQSNLDYPDSLGLDKIVCIIEGPENQKSKNKTNEISKATFNHEMTLLQIIWKTIWSTSQLSPDL